MVRLKDLYPVYCYAVFPFQFLMVRLKAQPRTPTMVRTKISIPYGSIKSTGWIRLIGMDYISIPYGSIKSHTDRAFSRRTFIFQFLMVRLKDSIVPVSNQRKQISIPYGSIKRKRDDKPWNVRLISIPYGSIKSRSTSIIRWNYTISIPYGSIKSPHRMEGKPQIHISIPYGSIKRLIHFLCRLHRYISIPYGSIKRCC